jgi:hypothetical protein
VIDTCRELQLQFHPSQTELPSQKEGGKYINQFLQLQLIAKINRLLKLKFRVIVQTNFRVIVQTIQPHGADAFCTITLKCKTKKG